MSLASPLIAVVGSLLPVAVAVALGERLEVLAWVGIVLALVGGALISAVRRAGSPGIPPRTVVLSLVAGVGLGGSFVALDRVPADSGVTSAAIEIVVGLVLLGAVLLAVRWFAPVRRALGVLDDEHDTRPQPTVWRARTASASGGVLLGITNGLVVLALQAGSLAIVSVLVGLYPVVTILLAAIVHRERMTALQLVGVACALAASVLLATA